MGRERERGMLIGFRQEKRAERERRAERRTRKGDSISFVFDFSLLFCCEPADQS